MNLCRWQQATSKITFTDACFCITIFSRGPDEISDCSSSSGHYRKKKKSFNTCIAPWSQDFYVHILTGLPLHKTAAVPPIVTKPLDRNTFQLVNIHSGLTWKSVHVDALSWQADAHVPVWRTVDTLTGQNKQLLEQHHSEAFCSSQHEGLNCVPDPTPPQQLDHHKDCSCKNLTFNQVSPTFKNKKSQEWKLVCYNQLK